ncbi:hypothetical protein CC80DRAFT_479847 [Byssothecium circinans]|uniref:SnoaL-like domain-containing protein n=1 Tax=Byssothecium circinans TaxID=147558 RepID=A0A6A5TN46_9PLEO|nr:hypothetical protein CC80DRAFT_479847 [Byssothecium circinans]
MRATSLFIVSALTSGLFANPIAVPERQLLDIRQASPPKPAPCVRINPPPDAKTTEARFNAFAKVFIYDQNITEAFTYIVKDYINHNPAAENGFDSAWNILSPIWASQDITPLRTTFDAATNQGWLNYQTATFGEVVDRFRWEGGCIAEHWDAGEVYPGKEYSLH